MQSAKQFKWELSATLSTAWQEESGGYEVACWWHPLAMRNISPCWALHGDVPTVVHIFMGAFAGPLWPAVDSLQQNNFHFSPALCKLFSIAEAWPPLTDHCADNHVHPMYTIVSTIWFIFHLVIMLLLLVVKLTVHETVSFSSSGAIFSSADQIPSLKLDPPLSFQYIHPQCLWATISDQCNRLKNRGFVGPSHHIWVWERPGNDD